VQHWSVMYTMKMLSECCKARHLKHVKTVVTLSGLDQLCKVTDVQHLLVFHRLWRKWNVQRRIRKLLTDGSRTSAIYIAANPHPQCTIQSKFPVSYSIHLHACKTCKTKYCEDWGACNSIVGWGAMLQAEGRLFESRWGHWIFFQFS
jgi:hypothetical protein